MLFVMNDNVLIIKHHFPIKSRNENSPKEKYLKVWRIVFFIVFLPCKN